MGIQIKRAYDAPAKSDGVRVLVDRLWPRGIAKATYELFIGMIEFALARHLAAIVTVTDVRMERILQRATWPLKRLGEPRPIGTTCAVAGYLEVSLDARKRLRREGSLERPVLWAPVAVAAA